MDGAPMIEYSTMGGYDSVTTDDEFAMSGGDAENQMPDLLGMLG